MMKNEILFPWGIIREYTILILICFVKIYRLSVMHGTIQIYMKIIIHIHILYFFSRVRPTTIRYSVVQRPFVMSCKHLLACTKSKSSLFNFVSKVFVLAWIIIVIMREQNCIVILWVNSNNVFHSYYLLYRSKRSCRFELKQF